MSSIPRGDITTLLDLADRDSQDNYFTPLTSQQSYFTREKDRRNRPFAPAVQNFPFRGPAAFGQRFTFDVGSTSCGDLLFAVFIQVRLGHWLDPTTILRLQSGRYTYATNPAQNPWYYANSIGTVLLEKAELEIEDQIVETVDGDFANVFSRLFPELNSQVAVSPDAYGAFTWPRLASDKWPQSRPFQTEGGVVHCLIPFFFSRTKLKEAFPLIACREGTVRIHITLRQFKDCVRIQSGVRSSCDDTPLGKTFVFKDNSAPGLPNVSIVAAADPPAFDEVQLITYGAYLNGDIRDKMLRQPFEILHRGLQTFPFSEPLKYTANKTTADTITIQLPLEANHPMEEIIWFLRRKAALINNNEWINYSQVTSAELDPTYNPLAPFLVSASLQINGIEIVNKEEEWFRQHIARVHKGGIVPYSSFIYGYSFARSPGEHQPSGTLNASRSQSVRLTLVVRPPGGANDQEWEVVVYVVNMKWLRFQNGIANKMFED